MGRRSEGETIAKLIVAFLTQPTWSQKDLERRCSVGTRAVRRRVLDLQSAGIPIEREEDHPHVYYSVPRGWFPGRGTGLECLDHVIVARLVSRLPRSDAREKILSRLFATAFGAPIVPSRAEATASEEVLGAFENSAKHKTALRLGYYTASRGEQGIRTISVQRLIYSEHPRCVAYCHRASELRIFRIDRAYGPQLDGSMTFIDVPEQEVDAYLARGLDGFVGRGEAVACSFTVRQAESHWLLRAFPPGTSFVVDHAARDPRVTITTTALDVLARRLAGWGGLVSNVEPRALRDRVRRISEASIAACGSARLNKPAVRSMRASR